MSCDQKIGILLVHGVGDQARYEHLHNVADQMIQTLAAMHGVNRVDVTMPGIGGAPLSISVRGQKGVDQLDIHEMWWRDLGQRQTFGAILKFWWWASSLAGTTGYFTDPPSGYSNPMSAAVARGGITFWERVVLFFKITYCFVLLAPINLAISFSHFIPGIRRIQFVHAVFAHLSSVQMYQEKVASQRGTLTDYDQTRRVRIQRRFAELLVTMAESRYDRWYIAGHSLGSVIALKGLMYNDHAFARLLNYNRWHHPAFAQLQTKVPLAQMPQSVAVAVDQPKKPFWLSEDDGVRTVEVFKTLQGLITYGSPLELFASIWPAIVQQKKEVGLPDSFQWINIYDPVDIVASRLSSFGFNSVEGIIPIKPINVPCRASRLITSAHVKYWSPRHFGKADGVLATVLDWIQSGESFPKHLEGQRWYLGRNAQRARVVQAGAQWLGALFLGCLIWPFAAIIILRAFGFALSAALSLFWFTLGYFLPLGNWDPGDEFDSRMRLLFGILGKLRPEGEFHLDIVRLVIIVGLFAGVLLAFTAVRAAIERYQYKRADQNELASRAVRVDPAALAGRMPADLSASTRFDL